MKKQTFADISLLLVAFVWGAGFLLVQTAIQTLEPFTFNGLRFLFAALFLIGWLLLFKRSQLKEWNASVVIAGVILGIWLYSAFALQTFGLLYTTASKAGFITGLNVVLVPIFAIFILKERPKFLSLVGVGAAAVGLYFLTMGDSLAMNIGDFLVFLCAFSFGLHIVLTGKYTNKFSALLLTVIQLSTVALLNFISAFFFENWQLAFNPSFILKGDVFFSLFITSIFATALAFLAQTAFQRYTSPTRVAIIYTMEPVFAALLGVMIAGETLTIIALVGCVLIFFGMILSELAGVIQASLNRFKQAANSERAS